MAGTVEVIREASEPIWGYLAAAGVAAIPATMAAWFGARNRRDTARKLVPEVAQINEAVNNREPHTPNIGQEVHAAAGQISDLHAQLVTARQLTLAEREAAGRAPEQLNPHEQKTWRPDG